VLRMPPPGRTTTLHSFDGQQLYAGMIPASDGTFYGTTTLGGPRGAGTVFNMTTAGDVQYLSTFERNGLVPIAGLTQGTDGNLYGTTLRGGTFDFGSIFRMSLSGAPTTLFSFECCFVGSGNQTGPGTVAKLFQAADGDFYGVADIPGQNGGDRSLFRMNSAGGVTVVHAWSNLDHEVNPIDTGFVQGRDGAFYGTTQSFSTGGKVMRVAADGTLTILHTFPIGCASVASLL